MSFLTTRDRLELLDFMDSIMEYLPSDERERARQLLNDSASHAALSQAELAGRVLQQAVLAWPARRAVQRFVETEGAEFEWRKVLETARPTTGFLLKRLRDRTQTSTLSQLLAHSESGTALQGAEREEIELLQPEIWIECWLAQPEALAGHLREANRELELMHQRLQKLEHFSTQSEKRSELLNKVRSFQERIYFGGASIPLEQLDEELQLTIGDVLKD